MNKKNSKAETMRRFEPRKRTVLDGVTWWCIWDNVRGNWSTFIYHGKYKTRRAAVIAIEARKEATPA